MKIGIDTWERVGSVLSEFMEGKGDTVDLGALVDQFEAGSPEMSSEEAIIRFLWELGRKTQVARPERPGGTSKRKEDRTL